MSVAVLDLSPAAGRSESPSQASEDRGSSSVSGPSEASERSEVALTPSGPGHDLAVDGDVDRPAKGRELSPTVGREEEPGAPARQPVKLVKLYITGSTFAELDRLVDQSGLSRSQFVGTSFVVGMRTLAAVVCPVVQE